MIQKIIKKYISKTYFVWTRSLVQIKILSHLNVNFIARITLKMITGKDVTCLSLCNVGTVRFSQMLQGRQT